MKHVLLACMLLALFPVAAADEAAPDCEADQPWIGYASTDPARDAYDDFGAPMGLALCEGEQWDGQDPLDAEEAQCTGRFALDPSALRAGMCMGADPNTDVDPLTPGARLSTDGAVTYVAVNLPLAVRASAYADDSSAAVYTRDNTPGNILATLVSCSLSVTGCSLERDCDQATYQRDAYERRRTCERDNTAFTLEHALLA